MLKPFIILVVAVCPVLTIRAQKEYNIWYFGDSAGLDFNYDPPKPLSNFRMWTFESSSSVCDKNGNLLFYTNGNIIYNKERRLMVNGKMKGRHFSAVQGSMILPVPFNDSLYYILLSSEHESSLNGRVDSLLYMVVDIKQDSGRGAVIKKETPLLPRSLEGFTACLHANGRDYWIATQEEGKDRFNCIRTINGRFSDTIVSNEVIAADSNTGYLFISKFSPDSKKVLSHSVYFSPKKKIYYTSFFLYRFDNVTGRISDSIRIPCGETPVIRAEFSPDSRFLYVEMQKNYNNQSGIFQFDLKDWNYGSILNSMTLISDWLYSSQGLQLGPDGRIYIFKWEAPFMGYIDHPNKKYPECFFSKASIRLSPAKNENGCSYYPGFWFREPRLANRSYHFCEYDTLRLTPEISAADSFQWEGMATGDATLTITRAGIQRVKMYCRGRIFRDSITIIADPCYDVLCFIPNAFTVNHDHINDSFYFSCKYVKSIVTKIFNRWGEQIFYSEGMNMTWDGKYMDQPCEAGLYFYLIEAEGIIEGKQIKQVKTGSINLLW
jgi:gliding motility-associated-like protein